jgi:hypothetical protein
MDRLFEMLAGGAEETAADITAWFATASNSVNTASLSALQTWKEWEESYSEEQLAAEKARLKAERDAQLAILRAERDAKLAALEKRSKKAKGEGGGAVAGGEGK